MNYAHQLPLFAPAFGGMLAVLIIIALLWSIVWKGLALWHAARNRQTAWFILMLIINTLGILEIVYLLFFRKDENTHISPTPATPAQSTE